MYPDDLVFTFRTVNWQKNTSVQFLDILLSGTGFCFAPRNLGRPREYEKELVFMNAVLVRKYMLHKTLIFYQNKVRIYHDRKHHLTWVWCALKTWFYSFVP